MINSLCEGAPNGIIVKKKKEEKKGAKKATTQQSSKQFTALAEWDRKQILLWICPERDELTW